MLIVGEHHDEEAIKLNPVAHQQLHTIKKLETLTGATLLFEEPEIQEKVAILTQEWFDKHLDYIGLKLILIVI